MTLALLHVTGLSQQFEASLKLPSWIEYNLGENIFKIKPKCMPRNAKKFV